MKIKSRTVLGGLAILGMVTCGTNAYSGTLEAHGFPLLRDVTPTSTGAELIVPYSSEQDTNGDNKADKVIFRYDVYANNGTTKLHSTAAKNFAFPACPEGYAMSSASSSSNSYVEVHSGNQIASAAELWVSCISGELQTARHGTVLYVANASQANGQSWVANFVTFDQTTSVYLESMQAVDYDGDEIDELMATLIVYQYGVEKKRVIVKNFTTGATIFDKTYPVHRSFIPALSQQNQ